MLQAFREHDKSQLGKQEAPGKLTSFMFNHKMVSNMLSLGFIDCFAQFQFPTKMERREMVRNG